MHYGYCDKPNVRNVCRWSCDSVGGPLSMPHFTDADLMSRYGNQQTLHFTYYLKHARPSFAVFAFTLANYRLDSRKLTHRFVWLRSLFCLFGVHFCAIAYPSRKSFAHYPNDIIIRCLVKFSLLSSQISCWQDGRSVDHSEIMNGFWINFALSFGTQRARMCCGYGVSPMTNLCLHFNRIAIV